MRKAYVSPEMTALLFSPNEDILNGSSVVIDADDFVDPNIEV